MGLFDDLGGSLMKVGLAVPTSGLSLFEDTAARIPGVNALTGARTDSQKALLEKQKQLAEEAKKREQANAQARMNALGQSMLAFNPRNQMMAQLYGPQAAFTPQQMGQMIQDPRVAGQQWGTGTDQDRINQVKNKQRVAAFEQQMPAPGPGPAPMRPAPPPMPARRF